MYVDWQLAPFFIECHKTKAKVNTTVNQNIGKYHMEQCNGN